MIRPKLALPLLLVSALVTCAHAQTPATAAPPAMPKDPVAAILLAAQVNGLNSSSLKPWHIEATYQTFDENGQLKDTGTYEEWWANEKKYKASYTRPHYKQTLYATEQGLFRVGDQVVPSQAEQIFTMELMRPLPTAAAVEQLTFEMHEVAFGNQALECIEGAQKSSPGIAVTPAMCFGHDLPAIRFKASGRLRTTYNSIMVFQQHYVAQQIHIANSGKPMLDGKVTLLEIDEQVNDADFVPPSDAILVTRKIMVEASVIAGNRISATRPEYPAVARAAHIQGTVVLQAKISKTGAVDYLKVMSGPLMLQQAALDAVKTWRYKPYLLNGEPVEVETQINVVFALPGVL